MPLINGINPLTVEGILANPQSAADLRFWTAVAKDMEKSRPKTDDTTNGDSDGNDTANSDK